MTEHEYTLHRLWDAYRSIACRLGVPVMRVASDEWTATVARWMLGDEHGFDEAAILRAAGHVIKAGLAGHVAAGQWHSIRELLSRQQWYDELLVALGRQATPA